MENNINGNGFNQQEEEIDIKKILYVLLRQWHWFILFGALGFGAAFAFTQITKSKYEISTSILVPEKTTGFNMKDLFEGAFDAPKNNLYNQIEIIKSYQTISKTLSTLNWRTSWFKKELFVWEGIYNQQPFDIQESINFVNPSNVNIYIKPISAENYEISVDGEIINNGIKKPINFEATGAFGKAFINQHFNFTLLKRINSSQEPKGDYYFKFNDLNLETLAYQEKLQASLKDKNSDIISCTIEGEEPEKETVFLNQLISIYIEGKMNLQNEAQRRSLEFINNQLTGISDSLSSAGDKFTEFRSKNKIIDLSTEGSLVMNKLKDVESEKMQSQMQLDYFENLLSYIEKSGDLKQLVSPSIVGIQDAALNALVLKLGELYSRRQVLTFSAKENNPTILLIDRELSQTKLRLTENLRNLIENARKSINSLKDRQTDIGLQMNKLPLKEQQMVSIQRQFDLTNEIYTFLLQKRAETNIALASSIPDVQIIDIARPETAIEIGLSKKMILVIGFILGLFIPLAFIIIHNFFDDHIRTQEDVENHTKLPILSNITHSPLKTDLTVFENPKSNIAESFRALRTNLQFMLSSEKGNVISIHSTNPGEGKSFNSINLSTILSMNNKTVVLVGADLRKPRLHKVFEISNEKGLSTYLIGYDKVDEIITPTQIPNLSIIPSGPIPPNPAEILGKPEMKELMDELRLKFDYIIIDNAPLALVTDGIIISQLSDVNIVILRYGISHKHQLEMINQMAAKKTINNVSIVVNDIKTNAFGYTYYKYYQYEEYQNSYYSTEDQGIKTKRKKKTRGTASA